MRKASQSAYVIASRRGLIETIFAGHPNKGLRSDRKRNGTWTPEALSDLARQYPTRGAMQKAMTGAYVAAHRMGIIDEIFANHANGGYDLSNPKSRKAFRGWASSTRAGRSGQRCHE